MKLTYTHPTLDVTPLFSEEGVCATASGTEGFTPKDGTWDSAEFNF